MTDTSNSSCRSLRDLRFLKKLDLDVGGRYSAYSTTSNATTFKVNIDAQVTNWMRVRGGFNRATRAPNLGELYLASRSISVVPRPSAIRARCVPSRRSAPGVRAADVSPSKGQGATKLASGQTPPAP